MIILKRSDDIWDAICFLVEKEVNELFEELLKDVSVTGTSVMYLYKLGQQLFVFFMKDLTTMLLFIKHCAILNYFMILTELWLHSLMTTRMAIVWLMKENQ